MITGGVARIAALLASMLMWAGAFAAPEPDIEPAVSQGGLKKIAVRGIDQAYARPGATLSGFNRVKFDPIEVVFHKDWVPRRTGSPIRLSAEERESVRTGMARIVHDEFVAELQNRSGYRVVAEAGPDVLRVKVSIVDLYLSAPDRFASLRSRTDTVSGVEMTIVAELYDSQTGELIARVVDRRAARGTGTLTLADGVVNVSEAATIASSWARILRDRLDKAHGIGRK
jgi:hypothetical protein